MRLFLGIILGVLLTISVAYIDDHIGSGTSGTTTATVATDANGHPATTTTATTTRRPLVNWDVVDSDWRDFTLRARQTWNWLSGELRNSRT